MKLIDNIIDDYSALCSARLTSEFGTVNSPYDPIYLYHRYKHRIIDQHVRELKVAVSVVPQPQYSLAYQQICKEIQDGTDLKKYQSRQLRNLEYDDDMLSHWGIQHLHLSTTLDADGYVSRTFDLLFVLFTPETAYVLGIFPHGAWCDLDLIEIIHGNWPHLLSKCQNGSNPINEKEHKILRNKHANTTVTVKDGTEYLPPGFGVTANGAPLYAKLSCDNILFSLKDAYHLIEENIESILEQTQASRHGVLTVGLDHIDGEGIPVFLFKEINIKFRLNGVNSQSADKD